MCAAPAPSPPFDASEVAGPGASPLASPLPSSPLLSLAGRVPGRNQEASCLLFSGCDCLGGGSTMPAQSGRGQIKAWPEAVRASGASFVSAVSCLSFLDAGGEGTVGASSLERTQQTTFSGLPIEGPAHTPRGLKLSTKGTAMCSCAALPCPPTTRTGCSPCTSLHKAESAAATLLLAQRILSSGVFERSVALRADGCCSLNLRPSQGARGIGPSRVAESLKIDTDGRGGIPREEDTREGGGVKADCCAGTCKEGASSLQARGENGIDSRASVAASDPPRRAHTK